MAGDNASSRHQANRGDVHELNQGTVTRRRARSMFPAARPFIGWVNPSGVFSYTYTHTRFDAVGGVQTNKVLANNGAQGCTRRGDVKQASSDCLALPCLALSCLGVHRLGLLWWLLCTSCVGVRTRQRRIKVPSQQRVSWCALVAC